MPRRFEVVAAPLFYALGIFGVLWAWLVRGRAGTYAAVVFTKARAPAFFSLLPNRSHMVLQQTLPNQVSFLNIDVAWQWGGHCKCVLVPAQGAALHRLSAFSVCVFTHRMAESVDLSLGKVIVQPPGDPLSPRASRNCS